MSVFNSIDRWHQTKAGLLVFGLVELALAYVFASWAIDKGNPLDYLCGLILLVGGLQNIVKLIVKAVKHG